LPVDSTSVPRRRRRNTWICWALVAEECAHYEDCTLDGAPISLSGDPRLLRRLVRNLLENAARHGKPPVRVELRRDGEDAVLCVIDSGCGIPEAERERVFLPFFQLAGDRKGTGLGLSLVRQIARLHGGEAVATSRQDAPVVSSSRYRSIDFASEFGFFRTKLTLAPAKQK
jgi:nitrogen fixation/metabolism regulation signal transduction histidine kinase